MKANLAEAAMNSVRGNVPSEEEIRREQARLFAWLEESMSEAWLSDARSPDHPLKVAWRAVQPSSGASESAAEWPDITRALLFARNVSSLAQFPYRQQDGVVIRDNSLQKQLIARARLSVEEFDAVEIESTVAWAYTNFVRVPIVSLEPGKVPTPDFEIRCFDETIAVECKARSTNPPLHRDIVKARSEIRRCIWPLVEASRTNYGLVVRTLGKPEASAVASLVRRLEPLLRSGEPFAFSYEQFIVEARILLREDEEVIRSAPELWAGRTQIPEPVRGFLVSNGADRSDTYAWTGHGAQMRAQDGNIYYRNPRALVVHFAITPNHVPATAELIRSARRQLPSNGPGIVIVRTPDIYGQDQFERLGEAIARVVRSTGRISGIALWHQVREATSMSDGTPGQLLRWQILWLPNRKARHPLSERCLAQLLPQGDGFELFH